ncbi:MAG TPA: amine dehydrogenase large subunit [Pseudomonas sp.]|uniref:amine dehydrogenase large subunit n=1 Tax=Pseudomonas sp. TaxID=306 RepID=UPI002C1E2C3E|nr:amine dehydrogenase large subunit [Pseudomonas sp.]HTO19764.1 amine dehydrogenase large subunit [Pseudomonas sp.]
MLSVLTIGIAQASETFVPEVLTVEKAIKPGTNVFVLDQSWKGASRINVLSADDLEHKGILSVGITGQMVYSKDRKTAYAMSAYATRITYGKTEAVLQEFDVDTLSLKREVVIPEKMAQVAPSSAVLALSGDERFAFVQNATPATSVTLVDLQAGKFLREIPTPGCFGIFPTPTGSRFTTVCGDGTLVSFDVKANGEVSAPARSAKIFDPDADALFIVPERVGKDLVFPSFKGNLYRVADSGKAPKLVEKISVVDGIDGDWAPGGVDVSAYNAAHNVMFLTMHSGAEEGTHKNGAEELWAFDLKRKQVLYRSVVPHLASIAVTSGKQPVLFGLNEESELIRYAIDPQARFAAKPTHTLEGVGEWTVFAVTSE